MKRFYGHLAFAVMMAMLAGGLSAETRTYRSSQAIGKFVPRMVDELGNAGFTFTVKTAYNEKRDGKQGFVFLLQPRNTVCELVFFDEAGKSSLVRIRTQDGADTDRFHKFFTQRLSMTEVGVTSAPQPAPSGWPTP